MKLIDFTARQRYHTIHAARDSEWVPRTCFNPLQKKTKKPQGSNI